MQKWTILGLMSGTSLDGLDIALCHFSYDDSWNYSISVAETIPYSNTLVEKLSLAEQLNGLDLSLLDVELGRYIGTEVNEFCKNFNLDKSSIDAIASHGHTVFHEPERLLTKQIGSGAHIAAVTGIRTICDFRSLDVALSGQGAPLVPIGDQLLFSDYDYCLNLGGIANISFDKNGKRVAFDISLANIVSNYLAQKKGFDFDRNGHLAALGSIDVKLLEQMNTLPYFNVGGPKSLGKEFFINEFKPILDGSKATIEDKLHTFGVHLAQQIAKHLDHGELLITGGGAHNTFWTSEFRKSQQVEIVIPNYKLIDFKEALLFAFLGVLRLQGKPNCLSSVTGAKIDNIGGAVYNSSQQII